MGALEGLDIMLNDALFYPLRYQYRRTLVDQYFSRIINRYAGVIINTGEDNYLTTADAYDEAHGARIRPNWRTAGTFRHCPRANGA